MLTSVRLPLSNVSHISLLLTQRSLGIPMEKRSKVGIWNSGEATGVTATIIGISKKDSWTSGSGHWNGQWLSAYSLPSPALAKVAGQEIPNELTYIVGCQI